MSSRSTWKSPDAADRARGLALLADLAAHGRGNAQAELARAIRKDDPAKARALLEKALWTFPGDATPPLADMLIKGEGGPADPKRAVSLLNSIFVYDIPEPVNRCSLQFSARRVYLAL